MDQNIKRHREIHPSVRTSPGTRSGIWAAMTYLAACGTLSVYSTLAFDGPDATFAGVIPYLVTAPWSLLPLGILNPDSDSALSTMVFTALPVIGALINAVIINVVVRRLGHVVHHHHLETTRATRPADATVRSARTSHYVRRVHAPHW